MTLKYRNIEEWKRSCCLVGLDEGADGGGGRGGGGRRRRGGMEGG